MLLEDTPSSLTEWRWNQFLSSTPLGHFQQSTAWAGYKAFTGWKTERVLLERHEEVIGGGQLLWRKGRLGALGFINKGPIATEENSESLSIIFDKILIKARHLGLRALIIQPPDCGQQTEALLRKNYQCLPERFLGVINATLTTDLSKGWDALASRIPRTTRRYLRHSEKSGLTIRWGTEEDLAPFFELMIQTCRRQQQKKSNPASLEELRALWKAFDRPSCTIRLCLAEYENKPIAGTLLIGFGNRLTLWKKGWSGTHEEMRPNEAVTAACFQFGIDAGYELADFVGFERKTAETILNGETPPMTSTNSRSLFNIRFGGEPQLLPESMIYFVNPVIRKMAQNFWRIHPGLRRLLQ